MEPLDLLLFSFALITVTVLCTLGFHLFETACRPLL
jgi:hypothetical protein